MKKNWIALCFVAAIIALPTRGQVTLGTPPLGSFGGGPEVINLGNLNAQLTVPIIQKAGRGQDLDYDLTYETSVWSPTNSSGAGVWTPLSNWGWTSSTAAVSGHLSFNTNITYGCPYIEHGILVYRETIYDYIDWTFYDSLGTPHYFGGLTQTWTSSPCGNAGSSSQTVTTSDGSGFTLSATGAEGSVTTKNGTQVGPPLNQFVGVGTLTDRNGNVISVDNSGNITDTLGTIALVVAGSGTPSSPITFTYTPPAGGNAAYTMKYMAYTVQTNFGCGGITEFGPTSENLVSEIDLPDGTKYTFAYEPTPGHSGNVTGRLASITLPTGGAISYSYTGGNNGIVCADGSTATLTRTTPDGQWTYAHSESGTAWTTLITDPQNNQTNINFQGIYETERKIYQGSTSGTLLETVYRCYNGASVPCNSTAITLPITQKSTYKQWPGNGGLESETVIDYNSYGLVTEKDQYAYGAGAPGSIVRKSLTAYASLTNGIVSLPSTVTVEDGSNNVKAQTTYSYDQSAVTATSGTPQHGSISGSRGNATQITYLTSGANNFSRTFTYFDTGNVQTATDVNGAQTTYTYGDCGNSFTTSISEPLSLSKSMTWNCTGGVATSVTDENGKTVSTNFTSDPDFWRPNSLTDQLSNSTNLTYNGETSVEGSLLFNGTGSTSDALVTLDSLGRSHIGQVKESPTSSTYDSIETDYDSLGRPDRTTLAYAGTASQTNSSAPATDTTYDALSRKSQVTDSGGKSVSITYSQNDAYRTLGPAPSGENTKRKQFEYDALGRLTSVCEVTSGTGSGACGQTVAATGLWTKYTYDVLNDLTGVTENAQSSSQEQTRSYIYDGLKRMTSETNPESGTTTYTYDTDLTCGTSKGDLVKKVDAVGNVTCYIYDSLHRITNSYVSSGSYASSTPYKYFIYDSATVNSVVMSNPKTRMAEAYTSASSCPSPCSSKITDEGFSYTAQGQLSDSYESTPHSGGYYHVTQSYWANGALSGISNLVGLPTMTYNVDGEGRIYSVSASSGQNPLTSTTYNVASQPTQITLGSSDSDAFTYDPNTDRMTKYTFSVNGQSDVGQLTWNSIGTLEGLTITDPFYSGGNQSCAYSHDDLIRIASANCGSIWSQTFTYDAFGNLSKSGTQSFQPTYSYLTNQMTEIGSSVPSYDADGNVTNDFLHAYSWDAAGRPVIIDGVGVTYDALGRMAEQNKSGAYSEIVYSPSGTKLAIMSGQALTRAFVPLAGGSVAVYNSSGLTFYRHSDWVGSSRFDSTPSRTMYYDGAYGPFGEPYAQSGTTDVSFTGMNQDTVVNLYDFPAREYGIQGRWPSPDPAGIRSANPKDPQSWNRYAYVGNNPLSKIDPTGLDKCDYQDGTSVTTCDGNGGDWDYLYGGFGFSAGGDAWTGGGGGGACFMCGEDNSSYYFGLEDQAVFGDSYYSIPGNSGYGSNGPEEEARYESIITDGWDPELGIDLDTTTYSFNSCSDAEECQAEKDAIQIGLATCSGDAGDVADCIQSIYQQLDTQTSAYLNGGNYNFSYANLQIQGQPFDPAELDGCSEGFGYRCGDMPSMHFDLNDQTFHVDTANPLNVPFGSVIHLVVDVILGHTVFSSGIP